MSKRLPPLFHVLLLASIAMRIMFGAPCCLPDAGAHDMVAGTEMAVQSQHHDMADMDEAGSPDEGHDMHGEDGRSNPCCSACGPTLAAGSPAFLEAAMTYQSYAIAVLHRLSPRDLIRQYEATGPPTSV